MQTTAKTTSQGPVDQANVRGKVTTNPLQPKAADSDGGELQMQQNPLQLVGEEEELLQKKENPLQLKSTDDNPLKPITNTGNPMQLMATTPSANPLQLISRLLVQKKENKTGLPDNLKSGIENLSGYSVDDVKVHYNSDKPSQLQAHAYAQGSDIHIAPGQEKHLPHEAWHVVQQKQDRVQPTLQMKEGIAVNDDKGLENEADLMGEKAATMGNQLIPTQLKNAALSNKNNSVRQAKFVGPAAKILEIFNTSDAPAIYSMLIAQLAAIKPEITINLEGGLSVMNFNFHENSINLNGKSTQAAINARNKKSAGWEETVAFFYSTASHELRHAHDFNISNIRPKGGKIESITDIYPYYQTELNAWSSEARALMESKLPGEPLVQSWLSVDPTTENPDNMIWFRIKHYTDHVFSSNLPDGWTWDKKMKAKMMEKLTPWISDLKTKFKARYEQAFPTPAPASTTGLPDTGSAYDEKDNGE